MTDERPFPSGGRVDDLDLSGVHLHGANLEGAKLTDAYLCGADISGDIEGLRAGWAMLEDLWAGTTARARQLDDDLQSRRVDGELRFTVTRGETRTFSMVQAQNRTYMPVDPGGTGTVARLLFCNTVGRFRQSGKNDHRVT
jgi:hypothetical protein